MELSAALGDETILLSIVVFESDLASVHAYQRGEEQAIALFDLAYHIANAEEFNWLIESSPELAEQNGWKPQAVPTQAIVGEDWWTSQIPDLPAERLDEIVNGSSVYVEERVVALLEPLGVTEELLHAMRGDFANAQGLVPDELSELGRRLTLADMQEFFGTSAGGENPFAAFLDPEVP